MVRLRPSIFVVLPLVLATLLATANAQTYYTAPTPSPLPDSPWWSSPPPPPPPEPSTAPPPACTPPLAAASSPPPPSPPPPASSPPPLSPFPPATSPPPLSPPPPATSPPPLSPPPPASSPPPPPPSPPPPASFPPPPPPPASNDWTPVENVNDPMIWKVAQFAVRIYGLIMGEPKMQLQKVVSGETQPSNGGYNYRLVITVSGGKNTQYEAFVWGILRTTSWKLLSFTPKY